MDNISKIMWYLKLVAKEPIDVDGKIYWEDIKTIKLSDTFFYTDDCISCGCCCVTEDNVFTQHEYDIIKNMTDEEFLKDHPFLDPNNLHRLRDGIQEVKRTINGIERSFYIFKLQKTTYFVPSKGPNGKTVDRCTWQTHQDDKFYCGIHPVESITCIIPHMRWFYNSRSKALSIATSQYGRNWALGCPIKFNAPSNEEQFNIIKESRLEKLSHLLRCADDLGVDTWLPEMIKFIEQITFDNQNKYYHVDIKTFDGNIGKTNSKFKLLAKAINGGN